MDRDSHQFSLVVRKNKAGEFDLSTVDKSTDIMNQIPVNTYTIDGNKRKDLAQLMGRLFALAQHQVDYVDFVNELKKMSKHYEPKPYITAEQKTGNCYVKNIEAGLKYALLSRNPNGRLYAFWLKMTREEEKVKWPISTLEMHQKFTDELVNNLDQSGYSALGKVIRNDFEYYKSSKIEKIEL